MKVSLKNVWLLLINVNNLNEIIMKKNVKIKQEVEIKFLDVKAGVRYWEDSTVNGVEDETGELIPCRVEDYWCPTIDVDKGVITNWTKGTTAEIHYKVCDDGEYTLRGSDGKVIATKEGYVPDCLSPKDNGYGDYIIMDIDADGMIIDWESDIDDILESEDED